MRKQEGGAAAVRRGVATLAAALVLVLVLMLAATPARAMRIVSLAPSITETLFALGAGAEVVGVSSYCDYPPEAAKIEKVGTFLTPSVEVILAKQPDLVIAVPSPGNRTSVEALESVGLRVLVVDPATVAGVRQAIEAIAAAVGREEAGRAMVKSIDDSLAGVRAKLAGLPRPPTLMVVGHTPLVAVGRGSYLDELIEIAGGTNVAAAAGGEWPHLSLEFVVAQAPEVIIDTSMGSEQGVGQGDAFWRELRTIPAVRDKRVYSYRGDALLRPGPRVTAALLGLVRLIHPDVEIAGDAATP
jgi:iron complex transport system substrate-binding protein